jgi:hypothetical protein
MPASSAASLALAARLRTLDDAALARLIRDRALPPAGLRDVFDLAEALLDPASIDRALSALPRPTLAALAAPAGPHDDDAVRPARDTLLADSVGTELLVPTAVTAVLADWPARGLPDAAALALGAPAPMLAVVDAAALASERQSIDRAAAERAFGVATEAAEALRSLESEPARLLSRGGLALPELKRLAAVTGCALAEVPALVALLEHAALVTAAGDGALRASARGTAALALGPAGRWQALALGWRAALPEPLAALLAARVAGSSALGLPALLDWLYPAADAALRERLRLLGALAERLGLLVDDRASILGRMLLGEGDPASAGTRAAQALAPLLPPEVDRVYVQHDLTVVSPGPLAAAVDARLRRMADVESTGLAGRYRITADSVARAVAAGESAESLLAFIDGCSLTGVPQPLRYLIEETAKRYGAVRVEELDPATQSTLGARTAVRSADPVLLESIAVDRATASLGLRRVDESTLLSRLAPEVVLANLVDARYPAAGARREAPGDGRADAVDPVDPVDAAERPAGAEPAPGPGLEAAPESEAVRAAVARIRQSMSVDGDDAGVTRQWQLALRGKIGLRATVRLPDGSERVFDLEPTGVGAGRVRGRDRIADVERTLPVASITALEPLD